MTKLLWDEIRAGSNSAIHLQRAFYKPKFRFPLHDHDFAELFFIESGSGEHCFAGQSHALSQGSLCFVAPDCVHCLAASNKESLQIINLAIAKEHAAYIEQRYFSAAQYSPWQHITQGPRHWQLNSEDQMWFVNTVQDITASNPSLLQIDAFLLGIMQRLESKQNKLKQVPTWLENILNGFDQAHFFINPLQQMCEHSGHGREYISRRIKRETGLTAIEFVNKKRMDYAARLLIESNIALEHLIEDCGFSTHAQFYRIFKRQFAVTPHQFRQRHLRRAI